MSSPSADRPADTVDPKLLEILVCPVTKCPLEYDAEHQELISRAAKLAYPIRAGIPIMLPEEARRIEYRERGSQWTPISSATCLPRSAR